MGFHYAWLYYHYERVQRVEESLIGSGPCEYRRLREILRRGRPLFDAGTADRLRWRDAVLESRVYHVHPLLSVPSGRLLAVGLRGRSIAALTCA